MRKPTIKIVAEHSAEDVKGGMDDASLMEKYGISPRGLQSLFRKLIAAGLLERADLESRYATSSGFVVVDVDRFAGSGERHVSTQAGPVEPGVGPASEHTVISARDALAAMRGGMDDASLMRKYDISSLGLQSLFSQLMAAGLLTEAEVEERAAKSEESLAITMIDFTVERKQRDQQFQGKQSPRFEKIWEFETDSWISSTPVIDAQTVFFGCGNGRLHSVNLDTGHKNWIHKVRGGAVTHQVVQEGKVFAVTEYGYLSAVDAETGTEKWTFKPEIGVNDCPVLRNGTVYVGSLDGTLYAVDADSGREKWSFKVKGTTVSSPAIRGDLICFGSDGGCVHVIRVQ